MHNHPPNATNQQTNPANSTNSTNQLAQLTAQDGNGIAPQLVDMALQGHAQVHNPPPNMTNQQTTNPANATKSTNQLVQLTAQDGNDIAPQLVDMALQGHTQVHNNIVVPILTNIENSQEATIPPITKAVTDVIDQINKQVMTPWLERHVRDAMLDAIWGCRKAREKYPETPEPCWCSCWVHL